MPHLVAQGPRPEDFWRHPLPEGPFILGREEKCDLSAPWDGMISRAHARLTWRDNQLHVVRLPRPNGRNPIFYLGKEVDEFSLAPGEFFIIGLTKFLVEDLELTPANDAPNHEELTCSPAEFKEIKYAENSADRLEALARMAGLMRYNPNDANFERQVLEILLSGIPSALAAAFVELKPGGPAASVDVSIIVSVGGDGMQISRRLVREAIRIRRQPVMYSWSENAESSGEYTTSPQFDYAACAPLTDFMGFGLYIAGQSAESIRKEDLKFAGLVADIFGQLRQIRDLQRRRKLLESFMSPKVVAYLGAQRNEKFDEFLKPSTHQVTSLFCDLRGFSRMTEDDENLQELSDRVSQALHIMTKNIIREDGVVGDFQGDAAMGFWGWPEETGDQVARAASAALGILREFSQARRLPHSTLSEFACGIGIAHGPGLVGRLGTLDQFKVGAFGPLVNIASRLEGMTKRFGVPILLDATAAEKLSAVDTRHMRVRRLAKVQPYGMKRTLMIHELMPPAHDAGVLPDRALYDYDAALENFLSGRWPLAKSLLEGWAAADMPSRILLDFIAKHKTPPSGWDGVLVLDTK